jgi:phage terminase large subunit
MPEIIASHNSKTYSFLQQTKYRTNILYGSAGSGKSWSIGQFLLLEKFLKERNIRILITGVTRPFLKKACWNLFRDLIKRYKLKHIKVNLSELTLSFKNNTIFFVPLDDPEKVKSFEKINYVWVEEATFLSFKDYMQLHLRCRGENLDGRNQLFFSFNPIDEQHFFKPLTDNPPEGTSVNHSTYLDNAFLDDDNKKDIERLQSLDVTYDKIYRLGMWATPLGMIYNNWAITKNVTENYDERAWGLDFGYSTNPAALVEIRFAGNDIWVQEHFYETGKTNSDLIRMLEDTIPSTNDIIVADSAEPKSIEDIKRAGFNIHPCKKGKDSVNFGINGVREYDKIYIPEESVNLIREIKSYKWKEDKDGNILNEPLKIHDHLLDALRYCVMHYKTLTKVSIINVDDPTEMMDDDNDGWIE